MLLHDWDHNPGISTRPFLVFVLEPLSIRDEIFATGICRALSRSIRVEMLGGKFARAFPFSELLPQLAASYSLHLSRDDQETPMGPARARAPCRTVPLHILGGPMRVSSYTKVGAGSARAPLLGLMALARSSFWGAPSTH